MTEPVNARTPELSQVLRASLSGLEDGQVDYCVLRNYEDLPDYTTHDVDILAAETDLGRSVDIIRRRALECGWDVLAEVWQYRCHSLYLYYGKSRTVQFLTFDVVADLPWGWLPTVNIQRVLASRAQFRDIQIVAPGPEAAMRLIKVMVRKQALTTTAARRIVEATVADPEGFRAAFAGILDEHLVDDLLRCASQSQIAQLDAFYSRVRRSIFWHAHLHHPARSLMSLTKYVVSRLGRYRRGSLGAVVVMVGPDGAGKTTLTSKLADGIGRLVFRGSKTFHSQFNVLPRLSTILKRVTGVTIPQTDFTCKHSGSQVKPTGVARILLYLLYYIWDYQWGRLALWLRKGRSQLILFDRYFYNYYYQKAYMNVPWRVLDCFRAIVPKPDVVLILQADPQAIYARKPELDRTEIERQLNAIDRLSQRLGPVPSARVPTDHGLECAEDAAVRAIVACVAARNSRCRTLASRCTVVHREALRGQ